MRTFLDALANDQLDLHPDVPLFRQGKSNAKGLGPYRPSCFTNQPVGKNNFLNVGKEVAQFLKLPDHLEYSTKSFLVDGYVWFSNQNIVLLHYLDTVSYHFTTFIFRYFVKLFSSLTFEKSVTSVGPMEQYDEDTNQWVSMEPEEPEESVESMEASSSHQLGNPSEREDDYHYKQEPFDPMDDENGYDIMDESNLYTKDEESFTDMEFDLSNIPQSSMSSVNEETLKKYKSSWRDFLIFAKIQDGNEPTKEDFELYFKNKNENGVSFFTLRALYSHLNKMFKMIHNKGLEDFPGYSLKSHLESFNQNEQMKPSRRLTKAQIIQFLKEADDSNRSLLVRKVITMIAYLGGVKLSMLRKMTLGSVKPHPKGYAVYIERDMTMTISKMEPCSVLYQEKNDLVQ